MFNAFQMEESIWNVEGVRVVFPKPPKCQFEKLYSDSFKEPLLDADCLDDIARRISEVVGIGIPFAVMTGDMGIVRYRNTKPIPIRNSGSEKT